MSYYTEANALLRRAITDCVIDPHPDSIQKLATTNRSWGQASILRDLMHSMSKQSEANRMPKPWLGKQQSWQLPATRRYAQSRHAPDSPVTQPDAGENWMVELARFPVPYGYVGIIKSWEQYVIQDQDVLSSLSSWGDPYPSVDLEWYLRLFPLDRHGVPWTSVSGASAIRDYLPGIPYDDLPESLGIWFPATSPPSTNIHLVIPGNRVLRVFCIVAASSAAVSISTKMTGTLQNELNQNAKFTVDTTW